MSDRHFEKSSNLILKNDQDFREIHVQSSFEQVSFFLNLISDLQEKMLDLFKLYFMNNLKFW